MSTILYGHSQIDDNHRAYGQCAKCGEKKEENRCYVHVECTYPAVTGAFHYCAVCGKQWDEESLDYVCFDHLIK